MRILLLTRYDRLGASSRLRSLQYIPFLESYGIKLTHIPLFSDNYLQDLYAGHSVRHYILKSYINRILACLTAGQYDAVWLEKEALPFLPAYIERIWNYFQIPYLVDYDDALFHNYDHNRNRFIRMIIGKKINIVMKHAHTVIVGNSYLAFHAVHAGSKNVIEIPTVVDLNFYNNVSVVKTATETITVGWIGTTKTFHYLLPLLPIFEELSNMYSLRFIAIGARQEDVFGTAVIAIPWSEKDEIYNLQKIDFGIMPLLDEPWERGKCGYKLIQYMACSKPVIASPVGINKEIVKPGVNGWLANTPDEWRKAIMHLFNNHQDRYQFGMNARKMVEEKYSLQSQIHRMVEVIEKLKKNS